MAELGDPEPGLQFIGHLVLPDGLEFFRPGELVEQAEQRAHEVFAALAPGEPSLGDASSGGAAAAADVGALAQFTDSFLASGPAPNLDGEYAGFVGSFGEGEIQALAEGGMPDLPVPTGDPPNFGEDGGIFDPNELPPKPHFDPEDEPPDKGKGGGKSGPPPAPGPGPGPGPGGNGGGSGSGGGGKGGGGKGGGGKEQ
jgi:hypothetical protein